ncbi:Mfs1.2 [Daedaleopsis nitida]|nr:Mfs1.2 [Daedaleopsis nitida]
MVSQEYNPELVHVKTDVAPSTSVIATLSNPEREHSPATANAGPDQTPPSRKGFRFWVVMLSLFFAAFFAVLEAYSVSTALPVIVSDLHADEFVWVASVYSIASTALLPLSGGLAQVLGRRPVMLASVALFALGGALAGAAQSMNMLIGARVAQGAGAGGILTLSQIILSDLVSLQERGLYSGLFGLTWALGGCLGPIVGGTLARHTTWRWIFYMNAPACGIIGVFMIIFLQLRRPASPVGNQALRRLDAIGNLLVIGATCSTVIGLSWGGVIHSWYSAAVLVPLCLGMIGIVIFLLYEWSIAKYPVVPLHLLSNRTSTSGYVQITLSSVVNIILLWYLPIYYQACKDASPTASGIDLFGLVFTSGPFAIITGATISATKSYRPQLWVAWIFILVGVSLTSTVDEATSIAVSIGYQIPAGIGIGMVYSAAYFPVLASLPLSSTAQALSLFVFLRTCAQIWGVTVGGALLQNGLKGRLPESVRNSLSGIDNVAYAVVPLIASMAQPEKDLTRRAFAVSLQIVWKLLIGVAAVGLVSSLGMKAVSLRAERDENWEMQQNGRQPSEVHND